MATVTHLDAKIIEQDGTEVVIPRRSRFVKPGVKRLNLSDGDWIEVKEKLTTGERESLKAAGVRSVIRHQEDERIHEVGIDAGNFDLAKVKCWLTDWSLRDENDKHVRLSSEAIDALDPDTFDEILKALEEYQDELEALKNPLRPDQQS